MKLTNFKVLTFDCYGTLIDWESGIWDALQPLLFRNRQSNIVREQALEMFALCESAQQAATPDMSYPALLTRVHEAIAEKLALSTDAQLDTTFGKSVPHWPAFPDSADALRYLKSVFRLVIVSNVDRDGFSASNRKLGVEFDAIVTAEDVGSYKPNPANFEYLLKHLETKLGLAGSDIMHTAQSLFHDHVPAKSFGLACTWIDRQRLSESGRWGATAKVEKPPTTDFIFHSMAEMADAVRAELGQQ